MIKYIVITNYIIHLSSLMAQPLPFPLLMALLISLFPLHKIFHMPQGKKGKISKTQ